MPDHQVRHFERNLVAMEFAERFLIVLLAKLHELLGKAPSTPAVPPNLAE